MREGDEKDDLRPIESMRPVVELLFVPLHPRFSMSFKILRLPSVCALSACSRSTIYRLVAAGLWTKPVALSAGCVGWPETEVLTILSARVAGIRESELRVLVAAMQLKREAFSPSTDAVAREEQQA